MVGQRSRMAHDLTSGAGNDDGDETGRAIPAAVKREVRQRDGFGCIFCGLPVFEYDHLVDFAEVKEHDPANIHLLCPNHHRAKTAGRLSRAAIAERAKNPVNLSKDRSAEGMPLEMAGDTVELKLGPTTYRNPSAIGAFDAVVLSSRSLLSACWNDGWLTLDMILTDELGRAQIAIESGELRIFTKVWDYELIGRKLAIWTGPKRRSVEIDFEADGLACSRGVFVYGGKAAIITPQSLALGFMVPDPQTGAPSFRQTATVGSSLMANVRTGVNF